MQSKSNVLVMFFMYGAWSRKLVTFENFITCLHVTATHHLHSLTFTVVLVSYFYNPFNSLPSQLLDTKYTQSRGAPIKHFLVDKRSLKSLTCWSQFFPIARLVDTIGFNLSNQPITQPPQFRKSVAIPADWWVHPWYEWSTVCNVWITLINTQSTLNFYSK